MVDCRADAVGVRVQRQADIAQKMAQESLRLIIKKLAMNHCQGEIEEVRRAKLILALSHVVYRRHIFRDFLN